MLTATRVVIVNEVIDCLCQLFFALEFSEIIHLAFEDPPEAFHRTIINTVSHSGHALLHVMLLQPCIELLAGVLKTSVTVILNSA